MSGSETNTTLIQYKGKINKVELGRLNIYTSIYVRAQNLIFLK